PGPCAPFLPPSILPPGRRGFNRRRLLAARPVVPLHRQGYSAPVTVRLALIGCGDQGRHGHLEALRRLAADGEDARFVAVCDHDPARAEAAVELAPGARPYGDYRQMLEAERPDGVCIATPPALHRE